MTAVFELINHVITYVVSREIINTTKYLTVCRVVVRQTMKLTTKIVIVVHKLYDIAHNFNAKNTLLI